MQQNVEKLYRGYIEDVLAATPRMLLNITCNTALIILSGELKQENQLQFLK